MENTPSPEITAIKVRSEKFISLKETIDKYSHYHPDYESEIITLITDQIPIVNKNLLDLLNDQLYKNNEYVKNS